MDIEKFGRIGICICKDILNEDVKLFHKYMKTNLLLIPAYSNSMDLQSGAGELSRDYQCIVVVANACSALKEEEAESNGQRLGFISIPAKKQIHNDRTELIKMYYKNDCADACQHRCIGKQININFEQEKEYDIGTSFKIEESSF